jgi:hypothetical protein
MSVWTRRASGFVIIYSNAILIEIKASRKIVEVERVLC